MLLYRICCHQRDLGLSLRVPFLGLVSFTLLDHALRFLVFLVLITFSGGGCKEHRCSLPHQRLCHFGGPKKDAPPIPRPFASAQVREDPKSDLGGSQMLDKRSSNEAGGSWAMGGNCDLLRPPFGAPYSLAGIHSGVPAFPFKRDLQKGQIGWSPPVFLQVLKGKSSPCHHGGFLRFVHRFWLPKQMAVGQNHWYHFGVGAPPIFVYFSGDWDVHWGHGILTHALASRSNFSFNSIVAYRASR